MFKNKEREKDSIRSGFIMIRRPNLPDGIESTTPSKAGILADGL
jgi:hypothetical protein